MWTKNSPFLWLKSVLLADFSLFLKYTSTFQLGCFYVLYPFLLDLLSVKNIRNKAEDRVKSLMLGQSQNHHYHNLQHNESVADAAVDLCDAMGIGESDTLEVILAAWFHDVGYTEGLENHEKRGCLHARVFLEEQKVREEYIRNVERLIVATDINSKPSGVLELIIRDADLHYLGENKFEHFSSMLRKEWELLQSEYYSEIQWLELNLSFLENHAYFTPAAKAFYNGQKEKNIQQIKSRRASLLLS
jgi:predicted metal-dependent HD superfamily phosphohydrolase